MQKEISVKLIAVVLVLILSLSNFLVLVSYAAEISNANNIDLFAQDAKTNNKNVEFDTYLMVDNNKAYSAKLDVAGINKINTKIKLLNSGYLKTGAIYFENVSFNIKKQEELGKTIQSIDYDKKEITLNQINGGTEIELEVPIEIAKNDIFEIQNLNKNNKVIFKGTYITERGKEVEVEKEIFLNIIWDANINGIINQNMSKYINMENNETLIEFKLNSGIDKNVLPIKETQIEMEIPELEGKKLKYVNVIANQTIATNGKKDGIDFDKDSFEYIESERKVKINLKNETNENNQVSWEDGLDEYRIILIYDASNKNNEPAGVEQPVENTIKLHTNVKFDIYGKSQIVEKSIEDEIDLAENIGYVNEILLPTNTKEIYKSFMYANSEHETEYKLNWNLDIGYANVCDKIILSDSRENFIDANEEKINTSGVTYYKQTIINRRNFEKILGQDGYIKILNEKDEELVNVTLGMTEEENIIIDYKNNELSKIKIETSKPQTEGRMTIEHIKAIKAKNNFEKELIKTFVKLENEISLNVMYNQESKPQTINIGASIDQPAENVPIEITNIFNSNIINLLEPETKIELKTNKQALITGSVNENIEIYINLINNKEEYRLFDNPVIDIKLPKEIEVFEIRNVNLIFEEELNIANTEVLQSEDGTKHIRITLNGLQTKYNIGNIENGASIIINANITLHNIDKSVEGEIACVCSNDNIEVSTIANMSFVKIEEPEPQPEQEKKEEEEKAPQKENTEQKENVEEQTDIEENKQEEVEKGQKNIDLSIKSNIPDDQFAKWEDRIKYTITIKNNENKSIKNLELVTNIPEEMAYTFIPEQTELGPIEYKTDYETKRIVWNIHEIQPNETIEKEYEVKVLKTNISEMCNDTSHYIETESGAVTHDPKQIHKQSDYNKEVTINVVMQNSEIQKEASTITKITKGYIESYLTAKTIRNNIVNGDEIEYNLEMKNISDEKLSNVQINFPMNNGTECINAYIESYNENTDQFYQIKDNIEIIKDNVKFNIDACEYGEMKDLKIVIKINDVNNINAEYLSAYAEFIIDGENKQQSNTIGLKVNRPKLEVMQISNISEKEIRIEDDISYIIQVKNTSNDTVENVYVKDYISDKLEYINTEIHNKEDKVNFKNFVSGKTEAFANIAPGEILNVIVHARPLKSANGQVDNIVKVSASGIEEIEANIITHTINAGVAQSNNSNVNIKTNANNLYAISGQAWLDENEDGIKDENEPKLLNIEVVLININTNEQKTITTNDNGRYIFGNLEKGCYRTIFIYDNEKYNLTKYNKPNVNEVLNSDVIQAEANINNINTVVGASQNLNIEGSNIYNIDIGLIKKDKFDLNLSKIIENIKVKDSKSEVEYKPNSNFTKVELAAKYVEDAAITITYKIKVTNEGNVEGYANKIVDYLPKELEFNEQLNKQWYIGEDGNIYTNSLSNTKILPGETKEITLVLTKKMTGEDTGLINNTAEIYESSNSLGLKDIDSIAGNKKSTEDDISYANLMLGIKTGRILMYISLSISMLLILGIGTYLIKKNVLDY